MWLFYCDMAKARFGIILQIQMLWLTINHFIEFVNKEDPTIYTQNIQRLWQDVNVGVGEEEEAWN